MKGIEVVVDIKGIIHGRKGFLNYTKNVNDFQKVLLDWENTGSVSCKVRTRVDFYNNSESVYVGWSKEESLESGDHVVMEVYWLPKESGNYTANITVYQCNNLFYVDTINFSVNKKLLLPLPANLSVKSNENTVYVRIEAKEDLDGLVIIPSYYPLGWIFESEKSEKILKGEVKNIAVNYKAEIWKPKPVSLDIITQDGRMYAKVDLILEKGKNRMKEIFYTLIFILIVSLAMNIYLLKKKEKNIKGRKV